MFVLVMLWPVDVWWQAYCLRLRHDTHALPVHAYPAPLGAELACSHSGLMQKHLHRSVSAV